MYDIWLRQGSQSQQKLINKKFCVRNKRFTYKMLFFFIYFLSNSYDRSIQVLCLGTCVVTSSNLGETEANRK